MAGERVIFFDGDCLLCHRSVRFIVRRDPKALFRFAKIKGEFGVDLVARFPDLECCDSLILLENGEVFTESTAALKIAGKLKGLWPLFSIFLIVPQKRRGPIYRLVARNRYRWFGKAEACPLWSAEERKRFLEVERSALGGERRG